MKNIIYGLADPRTLLIRYVGLSSTGLTRPKKHRSRMSGSTYRANWLRELARAGHDYIIVVLEECKTPDHLSDAERWWIAFGRSCGWPLTNATDGGQGSLNPSDATRSKMVDAHTGLLVSSATRAKMSQSHKTRCALPEVRAQKSASMKMQWLAGKRSPSGTGRVVSEETRAKLSVKNTQVWTPEMRASLSAKKMGHEVTAETRAKISASRRNRGPGADKPQVQVSAKLLSV